MHGTLARRHRSPWIPLGAAFAFTLALALITGVVAGRDAAAQNSAFTRIAESGVGYDLAIDSSDLPVIVTSGYLPDTGKVLIRCAELNCQTTRSVTPIDSLVEDRFGVDVMVLDDADRPILFDNTRSGLLILACADPACTSAEQASFAYDAASERTGLRKVTWLGGGAIGVVTLTPAAQDSPTTTVIRRCADSLCEASTTITVDGRAEVAFDNDGLPAYIMDGTLVRCADVACATSTSNRLPGNTGKLIFADSGLPIVTVDARTPDPVRELHVFTALMMHCDDPLCTDEGQWLPIATRDLDYRFDAEGVQRLHLGLQGLPIWFQSFNRSFDGDFEQIHRYRGQYECIEPGCDGPASATTLSLGSGDAWITRVRTTASGYPLQLTTSRIRGDFGGFEPGGVSLYACIPGSSCYADDNGNGQPDFLDVAPPPTPRPTPTITPTPRPPTPTPTPDGPAPTPMPPVSAPDSEIPATRLDIPTDRIGVDGADRPVWTHPNGEEISRCTDSSCTAIESSPTDGLSAEVLLTDSNGVVVLIANEPDSGLADSPPGVTIRRCRSGPRGFCDPDTSEQGRATEGSGRPFVMVDATLDPNDHPILIDRTKLIACADPLCDQQLGPTFLYGFDSQPSPPRVFMTAQGLPLVVGQAHEEIITINCNTLRCDLRTAHRFDAQGLGFAPNASRLRFANAAMPPGPGSGPVLLVYAWRAGIWRDIRLVRCDLPTCQEWNDVGGEAFGWSDRVAMSFNRAGQLVFLGDGFVVVCDDELCRGPATTEPVLKSRSTTDLPKGVAFRSNDRPVLGTRDSLLLCGGPRCRRPEQVAYATIDVRCFLNGAGQWAGLVNVWMINVGEVPLPFDVRVGDVDRRIDVDGRNTFGAGTSISGRRDGPVAVVVSQGSTNIASRAVSVACADIPRNRAGASCLNGTGRIDVAVAAASDQLPRTFDVTVGNQLRQITLTEDDLGATASRFSAMATALATVTSRRDGTYGVQVTDAATGTVVHTQTVTVDCAPPQPDDAPAVSVVVTCLDRNGRIDTTIVEQNGTAGTWSLNVSGLSTRSSTIAPGDWWRMPVTGRPDGNYQVQVERNGVRIDTHSVNVSCDPGNEQVTGDEVTVTPACRNGRGYILFQFVNEGPVQRSWVLEFEGVPNRSTSAPGFGASVRAVTGRPNGTYSWMIQGESARSVTVDC